jgi:hypothetical protein
MPSAFFDLNDFEKNREEAKRRKQELQVGLAACPALCYAVLC